MLVTICILLNRLNTFRYAGYAVYVLDDYSVHLKPKIREVLWKRSYSLVIIFGGIVGIVRDNATQLLQELKREYRN